VPASSLTENAAQVRVPHQVSYATGIFGRHIQFPKDAVNQVM
ncbi:uncharacterized protein METZ01_LOCUS278783, partial [marine metagenome]